MASTRNKNTNSNYCLEQRMNTSQYDYKNLYGQAYTNHLPTIGFNPSHLPRDVLAHNPIDIESQLFGINSTNLVTPQQPIKPELITLPEQSFFKRADIIMPQPFYSDKTQRPLFD